MKGTRKYQDENGELCLIQEGDYGKHSSGDWYARPPGFSGTANLAAHEVKEEPDGSITVSPSILCHCGEESWHGYLEHGVWRTA